MPSQIAQCGQNLGNSCIELKNCEPRALVRTAALAGGVVAIILAAIYASALPTYAIGLLAGGGSLLFLCSCIDCCRKKNYDLSGSYEHKSPYLNEKMANWAAGKAGDFEAQDKQIIENLDKKTALGENLLHFTIVGGDFKKFERVLNLSVHTTRNILIRLNEPGKNKMHPLHYACSNAMERASVETRMQFIQYFLDKGIDINVRTGGNGDTALDYAQEAAKTNDKLKELCSRLQQKGAMNGRDFL